MAKQVAPYGSWRSPITSDLIVSETIGLGSITVDRNDILWLETRPREAGRNVIVRRNAGGHVQDVTPTPFSARTRAHEYGGSPFVVVDGVVYFSNDADQRLYRQSYEGQPQAITPPGPLRYADGMIDHERDRLICVCEDHNASGEPSNTLAALELKNNDQVRVLTSGNDFYASPCLSPGGRKLAWLSWNHPNMPWDGTELWVASLTDDGALTETQRIAGSDGESIFQPQWSPIGELYFVSDRGGWWNLYRWRDGHVEPVVAMEAEFGLPQWVFGMSTYGFVSARQIVCAFNERGLWQLGVIDTTTRKLSRIDTPYSDISGVRAMAGRAFFLAGSASEAASVFAFDLAGGRMEVLRRSSHVDIDTGYLSSPEQLVFPTKHGKIAYGIYYAPRNRDYTAPADTRPPLIVECHGGPTAAASTTLSLKRQFWTSRGFAVISVNYAGSTGYGRAYRERLNGQWGIADVDDCLTATRYLIEQGKVDEERVAISGGSAGGYTVLCALTFHDLFKAGASYYGISDLEALVRDTHKFESRYLDRLVGPYPQQRELYRARSPIHFADRLSCPVIFFQGLEDRVVPQNQTERMIQALRKNGIPVAYLAFEGEQHGFRQATNIKAALDAELYFYSRVFGFEPADPVVPVAIDNL
jgi:dipeptidyl aminopeptidase/acylaminoacyl peptidase